MKIYYVKLLLLTTNTIFNFLMGFPPSRESGFFNHSRISLSNAYAHRNQRIFFIG